MPLPRIPSREFSPLGSVPSSPLVRGSKTRVRPRPANRVGRLPPLEPMPLEIGTRVDVRSGLRRPETLRDRSRSHYYRGRIVARNADATRYDILFDDDLLERGVTDSFIHVLAPPPEVDPQSLNMLERGVLYQRRLDTVAVNRIKRRVRQRLEESGIPPLSDEQFTTSMLSQLWYSAREIQRVWRGYKARLGIWQPGGAGQQRAALKISRLWRGYLGRMEAWRRRELREILAKEKLLALFLGKQGRKIAARARARRVLAAAVDIERVYRGLRGRQRFRAIRFALHTRCATTIQRHARGLLAKGFLVRLRQRLRDEERTLTGLGILLSTLRRHNRYHPPAIAPREEGPLLDLAFAALCELQQFELALTLLQSALALHPHAPAVLYGYTILLLVWQRDLGFAWRLHARAKELDPSGASFEAYERRFFAVALRLHPRNAGVYLLYGVMIHALFGAQRTRPKSLAGNVFRALLYFGQAAELDAGGTKRTVEANRVMFLSLHTCAAEEVQSVPRPLRGGEIYRLTLSRQGVLLRLDGVHSASDVPLQPLIFRTRDVEYLFRQEEQLMRARQRADATIKLEESGIFGRSQGTGLEAKGERPTAALTAQMASKLLGNVTLFQEYDPLEDETHLVMVVMKMQALQDRARRERVRQEAASTLQRVWRGHAGRSHFRRTRERRQHHDRQVALLNKRLDASRSIRNQRYAVAASVQAIWRGVCVRRTIDTWARAAVRIQSRFRGYRYRRQRWEAMMRAKEGPAVVLMFQRGRVVSGHHLLLRVYRCGNSYKLVGVSLGRCETYFGYLPGSIVEDILDATQLSVEEEAELARAGRRLRDEDKPVRIWQHERVVHFLISILSVVDHINPLTFDLFKNDRFQVLAADPELRDTAHGPGIQSVERKHRLLKDQIAALVQYRDARGLPLEEVASLASVRRWGLLKAAAPSGAVSTPKSGGGAGGKKVAKKKKKKKAGRKLGGS